jgi:reactive intermediate/imine deaminase
MKANRMFLIFVATILIVLLTGAGARSDRRYIQLPRPTSNDVAKRAPFSDGVLVGNTLYLAGRIGLDPKTGRPGATPQEEARLALDGIKATLAQAGMSMDDLVFVQVYCSDVSLFEQWNSVYRGYFHGDFPARAFLGSGKLLFDARFEVQGIAIKR